MLHDTPQSAINFVTTHPATTAIYTLSLHDALPIYLSDLFYKWQLNDDACPIVGARRLIPRSYLPVIRMALKRYGRLVAPEEVRTEEHTSELQSQSNLVCRLLLEKKKRLEHTEPL